MIDVPGTAVPVDEVTDDPPSLSVFLRLRAARAPRESVSVAVTADASVAEALAVLV